MKREYFDKYKILTSKTERDEILNSNYDIEFRINGKHLRLENVNKNIPVIDVITGMVYLINNSDKCENKLDIKEYSDSRKNRGD